MGLLYFKTDQDSERENKDKDKDWSKRRLRITHYRPDATLVHGHFLIFMAEIYSITKQADRGDLRRLLLRAAFYVRFMKIALQELVCLPVFYVNSQWEGECFLVFEHTDKKVRLIIPFF